MRVAIFWMATLFVFNALAAPGEASDATLYGQLADLNVRLRDERCPVRSAAVVQLYRQRTAGIHPCSEEVARGVSDDDLFRATAVAEFYSHDPADVDVLGCLYRKLQAAGALTEWHTKTYVGALVTVARYAQANQLAAPGMDVLPQLEFDDGVKQQAWRMLWIQDRMHAQVKAWHPGAHHTHVVAVVHPDCHFSVRALLDIDTRPELRWLRNNLLLVVPPDPTLSIDDIMAWNSAHPRLQMHPMYLRSDWIALNSLDTPTFYVVRDGKVLDSFDGWPNPQGLSALRATLSR
ncbi:hypothetical protein [Xanthomonas albilineans]|uniref:hypothetical protein n=1 Tax=Xanthomonas albilineans TaxID=29447 RepID=UPI000695C976|nr:hypothetical protein [Xanthomonas albilineans]